jgi:hypothetical protein
MTTIRTRTVEEDGITYEITWCEDDMSSRAQSGTMTDTWQEGAIEVNPPGSPGLRYWVPGRWETDRERYVRMIAEATRSGFSSRPRET